MICKSKRFQVCTHVNDVMNIDGCRKDEYSLFGSRCVAMETEIVSTSLLDRVQYSSYGTDAISVEIRYKN